MAKASIKSTMNGAEKLIIFRFPAVNGRASGKFIATLDSHTLLTPIITANPLYIFYVADSHSFRFIEFAGD